jgi:hypothetical protein
MGILRLCNKKSGNSLSKVCVVVEIVETFESTATQVDRLNIIMLTMRYEYSGNEGHIVI